MGGVFSESNGMKREVDCDRIAVGGGVDATFRVSGRWSVEVIESEILNSIE